MRPSFPRQWYHRRMWSITATTDHFRCINRRPARPQNKPQHGPMGKPMSPPTDGTGNRSDSSEGDRKSSLVTAANVGSAPPHELEGKRSKPAEHANGRNEHASSAIAALASALHKESPEFLRKGILPPASPTAGSLPSRWNGTQPWNPSGSTKSRTPPPKHDHGQREIRIAGQQSPQPGKEVGNRE